jgi:hypothetical protein
MSITSTPGSKTAAENADDATEGRVEAEAEDQPDEPSRDPALASGINLISLQKVSGPIFTDKTMAKFRVRFYT